MAYSQNRETVVDFIEWYLRTKAFGTPAPAMDVVASGVVNGIPDWRVKNVSVWMSKNGKLRKFREGGIGGYWYWALPANSAEENKIKPQWK